MIRYGLILIFLLVSLTRLLAQGPQGSCVKSTEGKEFWFGFMENRPGFSCPIPPPENFIEVTVNSRYNCQFTITVGKSNKAIVSDVLEPNIPKKYRIDRALAEPYGSETIEEKALHLVSDQPLNLYAMNYGSNSVDAAVIFPVEALGYEYYAMCYEPHYEHQAGYSFLCGYFESTGGKNSEFVIVASEDSTKVTITPSKVTDKLKSANIPFVITLNRGELYQVQSMNLPYRPGQGDLTGSFIKSDKPVALYSGSWATTVPNTSSYAWDHLYEQIPPVSSWGRKFVAVPLKSRAKDTYRILASSDQTTVRIVNKTTFVLNKGQFSEFMLNENEPSLIESDKPILLAQYSNSNDVDRPSTIPEGGPWDGDPFMLIISPVDQTREEVTFVAYDLPTIKEKFYVNIVTRDNSVSQIQLDNQTVPFQSIPATGYSFAQVQITMGNHNLKSTEPGKGFIAYVYGFGGVESYGYGVGFNLNVKLDLGSDLNFVSDTIVLCRGETRILDAGSHFSSFNWNTGETTQTKTVSQKGYYEVIATTPEGCELKDGIHVIESREVVSLGASDTTFCKPGAFFLDAGDFNSFSWSTKDSTRVIPVSSSGMYGVSVIDKYGCLSKDSILVSFSERPKLLEHQIDSVICGNKTATVNIRADKGSYRLTSSNPAVTIQNMSATVPDYGNYAFTFTTTDEYSCSTDTSFTIRFRNSSPAALQLDSACLGYSLDARYIGAAVRSQTMFTWILSGDTLAYGLGKDLIHHELGSEKIRDELSLYITEAGCQSQKVTQIIEAIPDLDFAFSDTVLCENEEVSLTAIHAANIVDYQWDWGDGVVEHRPGIAMHKYTKVGYYRVQLTVKTDRNCTNTISKPDLLLVAPIPMIGFSLEENQCLEPGTNSIAYIGTADTTDHYNWDLSTFLEGEIVQNPANSKGPLLFDLKFQPSARLSLQVISKFGCSSENRSILLKRKPVTDLEVIDSIGCMPLTVKLHATSADAIDHVDYHWEFGDGSSENGDQLQHTYHHPDQQYDLTLIASSATTGCKDTIHRPELIEVYPAPVASFTMDQQIFLSENPTAFFSNKSEGATQYSWDFGDGGTSVEIDPSHQYLVTGKRWVLLEAINDFGCMDTASAVVSIALARIYPPTAFSPKAIYPVDREFKLYANGIEAEGYYLRIMSRWNDVVFECKNEIKGWDGLLSNGTMAQPGNYVWVLDFTDFLGKKHRQTGTVMLVY